MLMKLIDKATLVAEIERIKKEECPIDTYEGRIKLFYFERFLSFINTLEVKEVDLEKEYKDFIKSDNGRSMFEIAKHFFELGLLLQTETNITFKYNIGESVREYKAQKGEKV